MSEVVIRAENLGKRYRIGPRESYKALRDTLTDAICAPFRRLTSRFRRDGSRWGQAPENTIWALKGVSFEVERGDVLGIIGRNGAGKSTLLKILSRVTEPTEGYAKMHGRVGSLLEVGTGFHPELTGRENIYLNGAILGMRRAEITKKLDEIVAFAEIEQFIDTPVKRYSSGMYMRLAFAIAAHLEPEILVVDEVLAVGDLQFQRKCLGKMEDVSQSGRTVLFVSHNMSAITRLCSRALLLDHGRIIAEGPASEVVATYVSKALGTSGTVEWTDPARRPGTDGFQLVAVSITDEHGIPVSVASVEQPIQLRITYQVQVPNLRFRCCAVFFTQGSCAFVTLEPIEIVRERVGFYHSVVRIPANLLAEGEYTVSLSVFASRGKKAHYCRAKDVVVVQIYDPVSGTTARGDYAEGLLGVVRPLLEWRVEHLGSEDRDAGSS